MSSSESWLEAPFLAVIFEEARFREERALAAGPFLTVLFCPVEAFFLVARRVVVVLFFATLITQNKIMVRRPIPRILLKHRDLTKNGNSPFYQFYEHEVRRREFPWNVLLFVWGGAAIAD